MNTIRKSNRPARPQNMRHVELDYKRPETLRPYLTDFGRIRPVARRASAPPNSGNWCAK